MRNTLFFAMLVFAILAKSTSLGLFGGTIVVLGISKNELVLAADSRNSTIPPSDDSCKIVALEPDTIFAAVGRTGQGDPAHPVWSATAEARRAHELLTNADQIPDQRVLEHMASQWASATAQHLKAAITNDQTILQNDSGDDLVVGIFGYRGRKGSLWLSKATIRYDRTASTASEPVVAWKIDAGAINPTLSDRHYESYGDNAFLQEIQEGRTDRAKKELHLRAQILSKAGNVLEAFAIRSAEEVVQYSDSGKVGGPIDAIGLSPSGISWIKRKANCPGN